MTHPIKPILACLVLSAIAVFFLTKDKTLPGEKNLSASSVEAGNLTVDKTPDAEQKRALQLLDQVFDSANRLKYDVKGLNYELKMRLQSQIADAVWDYDQERARRLFKEAFRPPKRDLSKDAVIVSANMGVKDIAWPSWPRILSMIVRRDPDMVEELFGKEGNYSQIEQDLAMHLIDSDPGRAVAIVKRAYDGERDFTTMAEFLMELRQKSPALSDELFSYALSNPPAGDEKQFWHFRTMFEYVFPGSMRGDEEDSPRFPPPNTAPQVNTPLLKRFLELGHRALMTEAKLVYEETKKRGSPDERLAFGYMGVRWILFYIEAHAPDKAAEIRARWDEVIRSFPEGDQFVAQFDDFTRFKSIESLVAEADKAQDRDMKDRLYADAWGAAMTLRDYDKAFSIIDKVGDKQRRADLISDTRRRGAKEALAEGDLNRAHTFGKGIDDVMARAEIYGRLALALKERNETARAAEILREIIPAITKEKNPYIQESAIITVANAAVRLDPALGFDVMQTAVKLINDNHVTGKKRSGNFAVSWPRFDESFPLLARADFDRALRLAQSLKENGPSMLAQVVACRGILVQQ